MKIHVHQDMASNMILFIYLAFTSLTESSGRKCCIQPSNHTEKWCSMVQISCPGRTLIYRPRIEGIQNIMGCDAPSRDPCSGLSAQNLAETYNCYWKSSCKISFPGNYFIKVHGKNPGSCSSTSTALRIKGWKCINVAKTRIYDMDDVSVQGITGPTNGSVYGIIRSHNFTPWNYHDNVFNKSTIELTSQSKTWTLNKTFESCHIDSCASNFLSITTDFVELDEDATESLYYKHETQTGKIKKRKLRPGTTKRFKMGQGGRLTIYFQRTAGRNTASGGYTKGGKGFVLCFRYGAFRNTGNKRNVCKQLMNIKKGKRRKVKRKKSLDCKGKSLPKCRR